MSSSPSQGLLRCLSLALPLSSSSSSTAFLLLHRPFSSSALFSSTMPYRYRKKPQQSQASPEVSDRLQRLTISDHGPSQPIGRDRGVSMASGSVAAAGSAVVTEKDPGTAERLSKLFNRPLGADFSVDGNTFSQAQIRATFYPKFENEKSDQETRTRMIEMVSHGLATVEVSLKHSGSLFMYAGHEGGAYAKNSFGNVYTAVGVFVLGRMFHEAWGAEAVRKQAEFNEFLEKNHMCISMELVTAVLGDHGQRPIDDYVVVTAVTELGSGKPKFFSTPELIVFCRKWRLPTNHVWLFSTR